ncbi:60S ribosomal protein L27a like [Verticillium longisporum]|uniref:Large ribosomal subunit protein uL15 n=1 Tax=Verticillium longisporum TaxID=100787 RepID=A0A8I2ZTK4_VERLO|nr:60S ribosomal protein L27a like [Verticillium longisporum]
MPTRLSKTRKHRGHVSAGHGRVGKHRKHPGGRGMAVVGMRYFHKQQNHFWKPVVNLDKLWSLVPLEQRDAYIKGEKKDVIPVIDLLPFGYSKLLGKGRIPEIPLVVKARWVSKLAEKKITEAGGVVELVA